MLDPRKCFYTWYLNARSVFREDVKEYGRPLALKLLYEAYCADYRIYMRWRDERCKADIVSFAYISAMARLSLAWREGAVAA